ncbi:cytochrome c oxidase subunit 3 [Sphingobium sp. AN558]|uniref:cytochrome c oxidase subunit 3 n=1 Tax=Sphingobium sp. AN558 TaxID=3133442 RepID=UPI0030C54C18
MLTEVLKVNSAKSRWPGDPAFWSMICGDMVVFGAIFCIFMWDRARNAAMFIDGSTHLNETTGIIFTLLMLVSSWFVAMALRQKRRGMSQAATRLVVLAMVCGLAFCILKVVDFHGKINSGFTPGSSLFFLYYFAISGMHLFHVIIAMVVMIFVLFKVRQPADIPSDMPFIECVSIFWHLTDFLWVMIFALLYLVR